MTVRVREQAELETKALERDLQKLKDQQASLVSNFVELGPRIED